MRNKSPIFVIEEDTSDILIITVRNNVTGEYFSVLPKSGARLRELWLHNGKKIVTVLKKIDNIFSHDRDDSFTNAKLSPFAGRVKDGKYTFNNVIYALPINYPEEGNACHGFVNNKEFEVIKKDIQDDYATCSFKYNYDGKIDSYPFSYTLEVAYTLTVKKGLVCTTTVKNNSDSMMPLTDGWHHFYDLNDKIDNLKLELDVSEINVLDEGRIPTGVVKPYREFTVPIRINEKCFDSCFKVKDANKIVITKLISDNLGIHLNIWQETGENKYNYLVVYTPPDRKSIAIEPMTSNVNAFNNSGGLISLPSNEVYKNSFGIYLEKESII